MVKEVLDYFSTKTGKLFLMKQSLLDTYYIYQLSLEVEACKNIL